MKDRRKAGPFRGGIRAVSCVSVLCNRWLPVGGRLDIPQSERLGLFGYIGYVWRNRWSRAHIERGCRTTRKCVTTSIRLASPSSETLRVSDGLHESFALVNASKLWNVARYTVGRVWDACGQIPSAFDLQKYLKSHERYADLHSQSSSFERRSLS